MKVERDETTLTIEAWARFSSDNRYVRWLPEGVSTMSEEDAKEFCAGRSHQDSTRWRIVERAIDRIGKGRKRPETLCSFLRHIYLHGGTEVDFILFKIPQEFGKERATIPEEIKGLGLDAPYLLNHAHKRIRKIITDEIEPGSAEHPSEKR